MDTAYHIRAFDGQHKFCHGKLRIQLTNMQHSMQTHLQLTELCRAVK